MQKLLSLPPNLVSDFYKLQGVEQGEWYCTCDPDGQKVGSGGGTAWLLKSCHEEFFPNTDFFEWLSKDKRILLHAGGMSRRLPAYAPSGKILMPVPVFRWSRGQNISQNLLDLQLPLYEKIMDIAPKNLNTLVVSGDVFIRTTQPLEALPDADVVCYGLWTSPETAQNHGVFIIDRKKTDVLEYMLQKPSVETLASISESTVFLTDIGIWLLSAKAIDLLMKKSVEKDGKTFKEYDLYSQFGCALGKNPKIVDDAINKLTVKIIPLQGGEFYHFGTNVDLFNSLGRLQSLTCDAGKILHKKIKPASTMYIQNSEVDINLKSENNYLWIENSCVSSSWKISNYNIITGVPCGVENISLETGQCIDIVPINDDSYVVRPYYFSSKFRGKVCDLLNDKSYWFSNISTSYKITDYIPQNIDVQYAKIFPVVKTPEEISIVLSWMLSNSEKTENNGFELWKKSEKLSAFEISEQANLNRLFAQREKYLAKNLPTLAANYQNSVFYQLNLADVAQKYFKNGLTCPPMLPETADLMHRIHNSMLRSKVKMLNGEEYETDKKISFMLMSDGIRDALSCNKLNPKLQLFDDQIVWARSPIRIDFAGGWTDTPPFSIYTGGNVVNFALELNGQPPLQVFIKPNKKYEIVLRSIDLGATEVIKNYEDLKNFNKVGSPFSIAKAALVLSGFGGEFCEEKFSTLKRQLEYFGSGIEITQLAAIPAGSGMGTSSILAATVLSALSRFASLGWTKYDICRQTFVLEQLLTTGGGWQDQYGGVFQGVKLLKSQTGFSQNPEISFLPDYLFSNPEYKSCHLLYYTGITRTAKNILSEIVMNMFLNEESTLRLLNDMKVHAEKLADAVQKNDYLRFGQLVKKSWIQNCHLDRGVNPPEINKLISMIDDYSLGYKLPGAGGGGYLYIAAKDSEAALRIRKTLTNNALRSNARFTEINVSNDGMQISVS